jgi:hypothetical protein
MRLLLEAAGAADVPARTMPPRPLSLAQAARELNLAVSTLRRWVRRGAPTLQPGQVGRNKGAIVDVNALRRWRAGITAHEFPGAVFTREDLARGLWSAFVRAPEGLVSPAWQELRLSRLQAAALFVETFREVIRCTEGHYPDVVPEEMARFFAISGEYTHMENPNRRLK